MNRVWLLSFLTCMMTACSSMQPRPALSSYGCMRAVLAQAPTDGNDKRLHCLVSAQIARQCSVSEAYLAGMGKEISDLFGHGDAEWADWQADRASVSCGRTLVDAADIQACCATKGY